ncbi:Zinc finger, C2H2-like protein, partial [Metarhizium hybridum]
MLHRGQQVRRARKAACRSRPPSLQAAPSLALQGPFEDATGHNVGHGYPPAIDSLYMTPDGLQLSPEDIQWSTDKGVPPTFLGIPPFLHDPQELYDGLHGHDKFDPRWPNRHSLPSKDLRSTVSLDAPSSTGSTLSPVQTEQGEVLIGPRSPSPSHLGREIGKEDADEHARDNAESELANYKKLVCIAPHCHLSFASDADLQTHVQAVHTHACSWAGCPQPSFATRKDLAWHVKVEHLLMCPVLECSDQPFQSRRELSWHIAVEHPGSGKDAVKEWKLPSSAAENRETSPKFHHNTESTPTKSAISVDSETKAAVENVMVARAKKKCQDRLWTIIEKKARKNAGTPRAGHVPTGLAQARTTRTLETASFPLVFEHSILPFLAEFVPKWSGPRHVISCTKGRTAQHRRICIMTTAMLSRTRKIVIARHVADLLPDKYRRLVSFVFSVGQISRPARWARGLSQTHPDDILSARNPYHFSCPCMGDSVGIPGEEFIEESTATLGPCLDVDGGSYWLVNFHPFLAAYQNLSMVKIEHPSPQDRGPCLAEGHDCLSDETDFKLGLLTVTSGLNLKTTRISHDPYWEDNEMEQPLVVTDWALVTSNRKSGGRANILRRFPSETQPIIMEPLIRSVCRGTSGISPGAAVVSSGRTSGYQRGTVCEMPAYVSAEENGTGKATREWFVEEPFSSCSSEDSWIRGGIGVEGDSGAAIVDAETNCLYGQLWGRNKYWGPGPRITFFTPAADIFDDIQEKCGLQRRPELPQARDEADRYAAYPSCRRCYDLKTYQDSRRSSRASLQSMINYRGEAEPDWTPNEHVSELATPRDCHRGGTGIEEIGSSFVNSASPMPPFEFLPDGESAGYYYPTTLVIDETRGIPGEPDFGDILEATALEQVPKRGSICLDQTPILTSGYDTGSQPKRKRIGK